MKKKERIYLSLGTNLGDRLENLRAAVSLIDQRLSRPMALSSVYESEAWGYESPHPFYNLCAGLEVSLEPLELLGQLQRIESDLGREKPARHGDEEPKDRLIDIDLIFMGSRVLRLPQLRVPHPSMEERRFVLKPLKEIAPAFIHPVSGYTVSELLAKYGDQGTVRVTGTLTHF